MDALRRAIKLFVFAFNRRQLARHQFPAYPHPLIDFVYPWYSPSSVLYWGQKWVRKNWSVKMIKVNLTKKAALSFVAIGLSLLVWGIMGYKHPVSANATTRTLYVDNALGSDSGNACLVSTSPCQTLQQAVNQAQSGDVIWVAAGTYTYQGTENPCDLYLSRTRAVVCIINKHLTLRGGYASGDWSASDPSGNLTVIDGEDRVHGLYVLSSDPNAPSVASVDMQGFTLRRGYIEGATGGDDMQTFAFGGGMLTDYAGVKLANLIFEDSEARGGDTAQVYGGTGSGGGLAIRRAPEPVLLENLVFRRNRAVGGIGTVRGGFGIGGGLYIFHSVVRGTGLAFYDNIAQGGNSTGQGRYNGETADGFGGAATVMIGSDVTFSDVVAAGNQAVGGNAGDEAGGGFGGAFKTEGMPWLAGEATSFRLNDARLTGNIVRGGNGARGGISAGGGVETFHTEIEIQRSFFAGNQSLGGNGATLQGPAGGGAIYLQNIFDGSSKGLINNCVIVGNEVRSGSGPLVGGGGGGIWLQGVEATVTHNTIVGNQMTTRPLQGSAVLVMSDGVVSGAKLATLRYNIIADHADTGVSALHVKPSNTANLSYNLFFANASNINTSQVGVINGMNTSVFGDPKFIGGAAADDALAYRVSATSAAAGQAIGSTESADMVNNPREGVPDIGAFEAAPFRLRVIPFSPETLFAYWGTQAGVEYYLLTVTCPPNANRPNEVECGVPATYPDDSEGALLTGLTNYVSYTVSVSAVDANGDTVVTDEDAAVPTDIFLFTPLVLR